MAKRRFQFEDPQDLARFRANYSIPDDVRVKPAHPVDYDLRRYSGGWMPFPLIFVFEGGVRFPLHPLLREFLSTWRLTPCQLRPNGYKVIMGTAKLNEILETHLDVHDIEHAYDVCKGREKTFYLRVKKGHQGFVSALDDSHKYAEEEIFCVSGNWEFSRGSGRAHTIPLFLGIAPSKHRS